MKLSNILFLMSLCCLLLSCGGTTENTPQAVATAYCEAFYNGKFKKAKSLCTPETAEAVDLLVGWVKNWDEIKAAKKEISIDNFYYTDKEEEKARVSLKVTFKGKGKMDEMDEKLDLVKVDGKWKVSLKIK